MAEEKTTERSEFDIELEEETLPAEEAPAAPEENYKENTSTSMTSTCVWLRKTTISASAARRKRTARTPTARPIPWRSSCPSTTIWSGP